MVKGSNPGLGIVWECFHQNDIAPEPVKIAAPN
jgi:hypothetical protein